MTKRELYEYIKYYKASLGLGSCAGAISATDIAHRHFRVLTLKYDNLFERKVGGVLFKGKKSLMVLNTLRTDEEQNFDCGHELIHFWLDPAAGYMCIDRDFAKRQPYPEWRANEGSAEFLISHETFIPEIVSGCESYPLLGYRAIAETKAKMAKKYFVTVPVITNRINSLKYEIDQFRKGIPLHKIQIISDHQQKESGIVVAETYNDIEQRLQAVEDFYGAGHFCPLCGKYVINPGICTCDTCWAM